MFARFEFLLIPPRLNKMAPWEKKEGKEDLKDNVEAKNSKAGFVEQVDYLVE